MVSASARQEEEGDSRVEVLVVAPDGAEERAERVGEALAGPPDAPGASGRARYYFLEVVERGGTARGGSNHNGGGEGLGTTPSESFAGVALTAGQLSSAIQEIERAGQREGQDEFDIVVHVAETDAAGDSVRTGQAFAVGTKELGDLLQQLDGEGGDNKKRCRICLGDEEDGAFIDLLCECRGDLASIHAECADRWFRKKRTGVCELCRETAYIIPPITEDLQKKAVEERHALYRYRVLLAGLLITCTLVVGTVIDEVTHKRAPIIVTTHANYPMGLILACSLVALLRDRLRVFLERRCPAVLETWTAVGMITFLLVIICMSVLMTFG